MKEELPLKQVFRSNSLLSIRILFLHPALFF